MSSEQLLSNARSTWREGITILRTEGILPFLRAGLREANLNHRGFYYYLNYRYKRSSPSYRTAEPFTVVQINPQQIYRVAPRDIDRWKHIGEVRSGDWDQSERTLERLTKYRSVVDRFENNTSWEATDKYRDAVEQIKNGETSWNGCRTIEDIKRRTDHVDQLYENIKESGFKSQSELHDKSVKSLVLSGAFDRSKTEVTVAIGRDGEFLFVDGNHRLAIAHCLELEHITVRVVVRHSKWQDLRDEIRTAETKAELSERGKKHLTHPDVCNLFDS